MQACHKLETSPLFIWILWSGWWLLFWFWKRKKLLRSCRFLRHAISDILFFFFVVVYEPRWWNPFGRTRWIRSCGRPSHFLSSSHFSFSFFNDGRRNFLRNKMRARVYSLSGWVRFLLHQENMNVSHLSLSIYNVSLWWRQLSYSFKDVVYSFYYFYTMKKFSLFLEAYFLFLTGSDLLLIHFIWTLFGKQTSLINGTRTLSKCPAPVWGIFIVDSICDTCFWYKRCGRERGRRG